MKKILYSLVAALLLSVILTLLVPKWLFRGDARWTYQNDEARVDVRFSGQLKNGRVSAAGDNLQVSQPTWLTSKDNQGTMVEFPVSYRTKSYLIKLTPRADAWGNDATLVIEFRGRDFRHRGKRRPAWVSFRNITLNGQPVAGEEVVWHNSPFVLKSPLHSSQEIALTFDICKPLAASDVSFVNLLALVFACLLLSFFFAPLKQVADRVLTFINRNDIVHAFKDSYLHIDPVYRRSFWIIFGVLCFAFGFHAIQFMWGDHDWPILDHTQRWLTRAWSGRYMTYSVKVLLSKGVYLPLLYDIITFVTLAINAVLLCRYWRLEKRVTSFVLCGLVLTAQPFTLCIVFFVHMIPEDFIGVTCALTALLLSEKIAMSGGSLTKKILYSLIAIVLVNFALAMYQVLLSTIAVAFIGRLLVQSFDWDGSWQQLRFYLRTCVITATNVILGCVLYKLVITYVFPALPGAYNATMLPLEQVPERIVAVFKQCFYQLYEYNYPFIFQWTLWVFSGFTLILILCICFTGKLKQKVVRLILLSGSLFATQAAMIVASEHKVDGRIELFGLVFFEVLVMVVVLKKLRQIYNLWVIAGLSVVFASVINDLDCLRMWKLGFDAEKMLWNRVLARLEIQKDFDPAHKYEVVMVGWPISMRPRYYTKPRQNLVSSAPSMFSSYDQPVHPFMPYEFYYPTRFRIHLTCFSAYHETRLATSDKPKYIARLKCLYQAGVLQKAEVWPKPNGLIVWKNIILFVTDGKALEKYRKQFRQEMERK